MLRPLSGLVLLAPGRQRVRPAPQDPAKHSGIRSRGQYARTSSAAASTRVVKPVYCDHVLDVRPVCRLPDDSWLYQLVLLDEVVQGLKIRSPIGPRDRMQAFCAIAPEKNYGGELAKLRKPKKVRNVVEKHIDHLHHRQLADTMDLEKTCRILGDLLAAPLFESVLAAKATFPTLFSPRELGNDTALIVKCEEDGKDGTDPTVLDILHSPHIHMPNGTFPESAPTVRQHRIQWKLGCIGEPTRGTTETTGSILQWFPSMLEASGWDAPEAVELTKWWTTLSKCDIPATAIALGYGQSLAVLFKRAVSIRHCAVHRRPRIPVKNVGEMVRDAWLLSQALQDDLRAAQLLHWEAAEAELQDIHNAKIEIETRLAELESRASQLTQSFEAEGRTHRPIDDEALRSLEEALSRPALAKALPITAQDQVWQGIENSVDIITSLEHAGKRLTIKVEPQGLGPRDQPLRPAPVEVPYVPHDAYGSPCRYSGKVESLHKRRKCSRGTDVAEQETFQGSVQDSQITTRSMTPRRTTIRGHESFRSTPDMQTRAKNETAMHVRPLAGQLQPSTQYPLLPLHSPPPLLIVYNYLASVNTPEQLQVARINGERLVGIAANDFSVTNVVGPSGTTVGLARKGV
ncbi:hypothetical protein V493_08173 [Pseudogymnoascus sp. VKM F-4281 (FW-2241)]|nr:hypothetical protein V493_08173 [Pseudogymnoascus sp. VKM F-4281 (FW-2241)]